MEYDKKFYDKLKEISDKIDKIETVQKTDIMQIKASVGSLTEYIADSQETLNFSEIQSHLDSLSYKIETCNNVVAKDLVSDISILKNAVRDLETLQRENLKVSQFEDFKNQHINLTVKNNESLLAYISNIKTSFDNIAAHLSGLQNKQNEALTGEEFEKSQKQSEENITKANEKILKELDYIKTAAEIIKDYQKYNIKEEDFASVKIDLDDVKKAISEIKNLNNSKIDSKEFGSLQNDIQSVKAMLEYAKSKQDFLPASEDTEKFNGELSGVKSIISEIQELQASVFTKEEYSLFQEEFDAVKAAIKDIKSENDLLLTQNDIDTVLEEINEIKSAVSELRVSDKTGDSSENAEKVEAELAVIKTAINDIKEKQSDLFIKDDIADLKADLGSVKEIVSNIISELTSVKASASEVSSAGDNVSAEIKNKVEELQLNLKDYIDQLTTKVAAAPSISEIGAVVSDINGLHRDDIRQINEKLQELKNSLSAFDSDLKINDFGAKLTKINDIGSSIEKINDWINKVGYINQSLEKVYARFGENADFDDISDKIDIIYENMSLLNTRMAQFDNISNMTSDITAKLPEIISIKETSAQALECVSAVKNKIGEIFASEPDMEDIVNKIDIIYENLFLLTEKTAKVDEINSIVCDIKNKTASFEAYKNETSDLMSTVFDIKGKIDAVASNPEEFEDVVNKIDILYDNLTALNSREAKTDEIASAISEIKSDLSKINVNDLEVKLNDIILTVNNLLKSEESQNLQEVLALIMKKLDTNSTVEDIENLLDKANEISNKSDLITSEMFDGGFIDKINSLAENFKLINDNINDEFLFSKIDLIYENMGLLNTWVNRFDDLVEKNEIVNHTFHTKIEEIGTKIENLSSNISDELNTFVSNSNSQTESTNEEIRALKDSFGEITQDISSISIRTNKLILTADDANKEFEKCISDFKSALNEFELQNKLLNPQEKIEAMRNKLGGIYNLLKSNVSASQNLNNAFSYLGNWADSAGEMITSSAKEISEIKEIQENQTSQIADNIKQLSSDLTSFETEISEVMQNVAGCIKSVSGISDAVKITLKQNQLCLNEIAGIKETVQKLSEILNVSMNSSLEEKTDKIGGIIEKMQDRLAMLEDGFSVFKNDDVSEIKSLMTGVTVQLGTSLRPDIDTLNDKIEKISESEESKFSEFENLIQEKIAKQEKQILSIEDKLDALTSKIEKLTDSISEDSQESQIKDVLNYIATQLAATNENSALIKDVAEKVSSFDSGINKIVSYIEE